MTPSVSALSGYPLEFPGAYCADKFDPYFCWSVFPKPFPKEELALPSKSTSISYQRAPIESSVVSLVAKLSSPNIPLCSSVRLMSLKKITGSENGPAEYQPGLALFIEPVAEVLVRG